MRAGGEGASLTHSGGACHTRPDAVPACCRAAELCTDASALLPLRIGTEAQQLRLGQSALTRGPAAPAAELSPAATTCAPGWHSDAVLLPAPCGPRPTFANRHLGALDHQVQEMAAAGVQFGWWALTQDPALALKISQVASPCARPPMPSSLKQDKMGQGRVWGKEAAPKTLLHRHTSSIE